MPATDHNPEARGDSRARATGTPGPLYRAMFDPAATAELFAAPELSLNPEVQSIAEQSLAAIRRQRSAGTLYQAGRLSDAIFSELGGCGYWGLMLPREFGGAGATLRQYAEVLKRVAAQEPSLANLASVHGCLGAAGVVAAFGNDDQRRRWLPMLASGQRLSAFAMTEPDAGSDLSAQQTTAKRDGDHYFLSGTKVFITNLAPGRVVALVCKLEDKPAVLIAQLPESDTPECRFLDYGIHAARRSGNRGMVLQDFAVPVADRIDPPSGSGLTVAYHGLNRGRMSLCAAAGGVLRRLLAGLLPWVRSRQTFGQPIGDRPLVQRRIGRLASLIVGCDALAAWCATLLDDGYRADVDCMIAKIFAANALHEAATNLALRTYGGRSFLVGNPIGDSLHDLLAPVIYEGENELLSLGLVASLAKARISTVASSGRSDALDGRAASDGAIGLLQRLGARLDRRLARLGSDALADQHWTLQFSLRVQAAVAIGRLVANKNTQDSAVSRLSKDALHLTLRHEISGKVRSAKVFHREAAVGRLIIKQGWSELDGASIDEPPRFDPLAGLAAASSNR